MDGFRKSRTFELSGIIALFVVSFVRTAWEVQVRAAWLAVQHPLP